MRIKDVMDADKSRELYNILSISKKGSEWCSIFSSEMYALLQLSFNSHYRETNAYDNVNKFLDLSIDWADKAHIYDWRRLHSYLSLFRSCFSMGAIEGLDFTNRFYTEDLFADRLIQLHTNKLVNLRSVSRSEVFQKVREVDPDIKDIICFTENSTTVTKDSITSIVKQINQIGFDRQHRINILSRLPVRKSKTIKVYQDKDFICIYKTK